MLWLTTPASLTIAGVLSFHLGLGRTDVGVHSTHRQPRQHHEHRAEQEGHAGWLPAAPTRIPARVGPNTAAAWEER